MYKHSPSISKNEESPYESILYLCDCERKTVPSISIKAQHILSAIRRISEYLLLYYAANVGTETIASEVILKSEFKLIQTLMQISSCVLKSCFEMCSEAHCCEGW